MQTYDRPVDSPHDRPNTDAANSIPDTFAFREVPKLKKNIAVG